MNLSKNKEEYIAKIAEILDDAVSDMTSEGGGKIE